MMMQLGSIKVSAILLLLLASYGARLRAKPDEEGAKLIDPACGQRNDRHGACSPRFQAIARAGRWVQRLGATLHLENATTSQLADERVVLTTTTRVSRVVDCAVKCENLVSVLVLGRAVPLSARQRLFECAQPPRNQWRWSAIPLAG